MTYNVFGGTLSLNQSINHVPSLSLTHTVYSHSLCGCLQQFNDDGESVMLHNVEALQGGLWCSLRWREWVEWTLSIGLIDRRYVNVYLFIM